MNDHFIESAVKFDCAKIWLDILGTDFSHPCFRCNEMPHEGDVWRVETLGGVIREGHSRCFADIEKTHAPMLYEIVRTIPEAVRNMYLSPQQILWLAAIEEKKC